MSHSFPIGPSFGARDIWDHTSCRYAEGGLSFYSDRITACGIGHRGKGIPVLANYNGGRVPLAEIEIRRSELIEKNQIGCESPCNGCPNLQRRLWPVRTGKISWIGITHFNGCNNACDYCWLQWAANGRGSSGYRTASYSIQPAIQELMENNLIASDAVVNFGGGGEPTIAPEFEMLFELVMQRHLEIWLHTNGVSLPQEYTECMVIWDRLSVVCSIDAGTAKTYYAVKKRDHFDRVWGNLQAYRNRGARVFAKYIVKENNCSWNDIEQFVGLVKKCGIANVLWDIDQREHDPSSSILGSVARLHDLCGEGKISIAPASIGLPADDLPSFYRKVGRMRGMCEEAWTQT